MSLAQDHVDEFIEMWDNYFVENNIDDSKFTTRLIFKPKEWNGEKQGITFFESEKPKEGEVLYIELVTTDINGKYISNVKNNCRSLYKLEYRPTSEYDIFNRISLKKIPYKVIGVEYEQLILCLEKSITHIDDKKKIDNNLLETLELQTMEDSPFGSMTIRDFYCILHNVPKTRQKWLNDLIKENGRKEDNITNGSCSCKN